MIWYWGAVNIQVKLYWNFPLGLNSEPSASKRFFLWWGRQGVTVNSLSSNCCQSPHIKYTHAVYLFSNITNVITLKLVHRLLDSKPQVHTSSQPLTRNSICCHAWPIQLPTRTNSIAVTPAGATKSQMQMVNTTVEQIFGTILEICVPNEHCTCQSHGFMHVAVIRLHAASVFTHLLQTSTSEDEKYPQKNVKPSHGEMGRI